MGKLIHYISIFLVCSSLLSCGLDSGQREPISPDRALKLAEKKIEKYESLWSIDIELLPPLKMTEQVERYKFEVEDKKQNIWIVVSVSLYGEVNVSSLPLTERAKRIEKAKKL